MLSNKVISFISSNKNTGGGKEFVRAGTMSRLWNDSSTKPNKGSQIVVGGGDGGAYRTADSTNSKLLLDKKKKLTNSRSSFRPAAPPVNEKAPIFSIVGSNNAILPNIIDAGNSQARGGGSNLSLGAQSRTKSKQASQKLK